LLRITNVRVWLVIGCVTVLSIAPALGCPRGQRCLLKPLHVDDAKPSLRSLRLAPLARHSSDDIEMPWIWEVLRKQVYGRMPHYEEPHRLTLVLAPVVVKSQTDTVPGVGVSGNF